MRNHGFRGLAASLVVALGLALGLGSGAASLAARAVPALAGNPFVTTATASTPTQWPTRFVTITVTSTGDFSGFLFLPHVELYDATINQIIDVCPTTSCFWNVTQPTPQTHQYSGLLVPFGESGENALLDVSTVLDVTWKGVTVSLVATNSHPLVGQGVLLTSTTSEDVGPSPFFTQIYDLTTGTRLTTSGQCGSGTTCVVSQQYNVVTTHTYVAYESANDPANPPSELQEASNQAIVTWAPHIMPGA